MRCILLPLSHLQPFLYPQSLFPDFFLFLQHSPYSFSALSEEKQQRKIDMKQILSSSKGWRKQVREPWTRSTVGLYKDKKASHCYSPSKSNTTKEADRCLLAGRAAVLVLLVGQNLPACWRSPKARAGSLAWLFPVPKTEYCRTQQMLEANYKGEVQHDQDPIINAQDLTEIIPVVSLPARNREYVFQ